MSQREVDIEASPSITKTLTVNASLGSIMCYVACEEFHLKFCRFDCVVLTTRGKLIVLAVVSLLLVVTVGIAVGLTVG